jgi:hypothetical protein
MYRTLDIYKIKEINLDNINYGNVQGKNNRKCCFIKYNNKDRLLFQTCELYNINKPIKKNDYYELDIPLYGKSINKTNAIIDFFNKLDQKNSSHGKQHINEWINGYEHIKYKSIIRKSTNENSEVFANGFIKIKIVPHTTRILYNNKIISPDKLKSDTHIRLILECYALWITDKGFGLYMRPLMIEQKDIIHENIEFRPDSPDSPDEHIYNDMLDTEMEDNISKVIKDNTNVDVLESHIDEESVINNTNKNLEEESVIINNTKKYLDEYSNNPTVTDNYLGNIVSDSNDDDSETIHLVNDLTIENR